MSARLVKREFDWLADAFGPPPQPKGKDEFTRKEFWLSRKMRGETRGMGWAHKFLQDEVEAGRLTSRTWEKKLIYRFPVKKGNR